MNGIHQFLVYAGDVKSLDKINAIEGKTEVPYVGSMEVGLEVNAEKIKCTR